MSAVIELRARHRERFLETHGIKLGFMSFFVKACVQALQAVPAVNAMIRGSDIVYRNYCDGRHRRGRRPGFGRAGHPQRPIAQLRRDRESGRRLRRARQAEPHRAFRASGRHLHHQQRRHLRLHALNADRQLAAKRHPGHARHRAARSRPRRPNRRPPDDVSRPDLRPSPDRRPRSGHFSQARQGNDRRPRRAFCSRFDCGQPLADKQSHAGRKT